MCLSHNPLISVVVPVYNQQPYLNQCITSVLNQKYENFELILVDDGSTDDSSKICDEYQAQDSRIRVIHKENGGLVTARKEGCLAAQGGYIYPLDSDDWIEKDTLQNYIDILSKYNVDVILSACRYDGGDTSQKRLNEFPEGVYDLEVNGNPVLKNLFVKEKNPKERGVRCNLWSRLYRMELYRKWQFSVPDVIANGEDDAAFFPILLDAKLIYFSEDYSYHVRIHSDSMSSDRRKHDLIQQGKLEEHMKSVLHENWPEYQNAWNLYMAIRLQEYRERNLGALTARRGYWFPFGQIPPRSRVVIYGYGKVGKSLVMQVEETGYCSLAGIIDSKPEDDGVLSIDEITKLEYDVVVVAVKSENAVAEISASLKAHGVVEEKIFWTDYKLARWQW